MDATSTEMKIRQAALKEFSLSGLEGARVDRIARRAKINKAMIYYHFKNKESLYEAVLSEVYQTIVSRVIERVPRDKKPEEQLEIIVSEFINFIKELDPDFVRVMLREVSSGGKYIKKLMLPRLILPMMKIVLEIFNQGENDGTFKKVMPQYTFMQTIGSIFYFNAMRTVLSDTEIGELLFQGDFFETYKNNLLSILKHGILAS